MKSIFDLNPKLLQNIKISYPGGKEKARLLHCLIDKPEYNKILESGNGLLQLDFVWSNEYHPWSLVARLYNLYRACHYKRQTDIQTLYLYYQNFNLIKVESGNFTTRINLYWNYPYIMKHESQIYPIDNKKVKIYIATWNHLFSMENLNPLSIEMIETVADLPIYFK